MGQFLGHKLTLWARDISFKAWSILMLFQIENAELKTKTDKYPFILASNKGPGLCSNLLTICSILLIVVTLPLSLFYVVKEVQVGSWLKWPMSEHFCGDIFI